MLAYPGGLLLQTSSPTQNTDWPACPPFWLWRDDQWKSQIWLKACNRLNKAGEMVGALGPAGHGGGRLRLCKLESEHCWRCESGDRRCEVVQF